MFDLLYNCDRYVINDTLVSSLQMMYTGKIVQNLYREVLTKRQKYLFEWAKKYPFVTVLITLGTGM